jgi:hypothetical protein
MSACRRRRTGGLGSRLTGDARMVAPWVTGTDQAQRLRRICGQADLVEVLRGGRKPCPQTAPASAGCLGGRGPWHREHRRGSRWKDPCAGTAEWPRVTRDQAASASAADRHAVGKTPREHVPSRGTTLCDRRKSSPRQPAAGKRPGHSSSRRPGRSSRPDHGARNTAAPPASLGVSSIADVYRVPGETGRHAGRLGGPAQHVAHRSARRAGWTSGIARLKPPVRVSAGAPPAADTNAAGNITPGAAVNQPCATWR